MGMGRDFYDRAPKSSRPILASYCQRFTSNFNRDRYVHMMALLLIGCGLVKTPGMGTGELLPNFVFSNYITIQT
jgi:hypothetical protein